MKNIDVSVIVPVYGVEGYIEESLRQLFTQTKTDGVEFIIVNDCTKDRSIEIARTIIAEYPNLDIKIVEHTQNKGIAAARETGNKCARGEYILHIDSDDWCETGMIEGLYNKAKECNADIVSCDFRRVGDDGSVSEVKEAISSDNFECISAMLSNKMHGMVWNKLIRRSLYVENKIEFVEGINLGEDLIFCLKLFCYAKKIAYLPEVYYSYRYRAQSITALYANERLGDIEAYLADIEQFFVERGFYERVERPLMYKKVIERLSLMKNTRGASRRKYSRLYPEADSYIMDCDSIPKYLRTALVLASKGSMVMFEAIMLYRKMRARE